MLDRQQPLKQTNVCWRTNIGNLSCHKQIWQRTLGPPFLHDSISRLSFVNSQYLLRLIHAYVMELSCLLYLLAAVTWKVLALGSLKDIRLAKVFTITRWQQRAVVISSLGRSFKDFILASVSVVPQGYSGSDTDDTQTDVCILFIWVYPQIIRSRSIHYN